MRRTLMDYPTHWHATSMAMFSVVMLSGAAAFGQADADRHGPAAGQAAQSPSASEVSDIAQAAGDADPAAASAEQRAAMLTERLTEAYNRLYVATDETDRSVLLIEMLDDPVAAVRLLALSLIERKVLNAQPIEDPVREAVRPLLTDGSAAVRARAAGLLRIVDDEPAVALVIDRLADEDDPRVLNAYLSLLARQPTEAAVDPAIDLLGDPATSAEAAELLIRAVEEDQLTDAQRRRALATGVAMVNDGRRIEPAAVRLVGRLATEDQAALMKKLLDHADEAVRLAAAEAFVVGPLNYLPLMERLADPVLGPRAVAAAARHAETLEAALGLLRHEPTDAEQRQRWRGAIAAIAGRLSAPDLRKLDDAAPLAANHPALRQAVLKAALGLPAERYVADRTELLLRLGEAQMDTGQAEALGRTLAAIDQPRVADEDRGRLLRLRIEHELHAGRYDEAIQTAEALFEADRAVAGWLAGQLLDAAEHTLGARQTEQAGVLLVQIQAMLGPTLSQADQQRYEQLRSRLNDLQKPADPLGTGG